ncbi:protease modulator HflC [Frateuria aurantia]
MKPFSLIIALLLVMLGYAGVYVVAEGHAGAVSQFGKLVRLDETPGLHFKWPLLQQAEQVDIRVQSTDAAGVQQVTADQQAVNLDVALKWRVQDSRRFLAADGSGQTVAAQLRQWADEQLRSRVQAYRLSQLVALPQDQLFGPAAKVLAEQLSKRLGVEVLNLELRQLSVPDAALAEVYRGMQSSESQMATQLRTQGQSDADKIQADADRAARQQVADARTQASRIRGEGEAKALQIDAAAAAQDPDFFAFYQGLQAYRAAFGQGGNVWILRPDSAFFKTMESGATSATVARDPSH